MKSYRIIWRFVRLVLFAVAFVKHFAKHFAANGQLALTDTEKLTGMVDEHRQALLKLIKSDLNLYDFAIFVRPSDPTSTKLVKAKSYATKGLDVHSKSSNWGPQSGYVVQRHAFSVVVVCPALIFFSSL